MSLEMTTPTLAARDPDLRGLRVLVIGSGKSGFAAARLARSKGAQVLVVDRRAEAELGELPRRLRESGIEVRTGGHPAQLVETADLVVTSPGVPASEALLRAARSRGLPLWGEIGTTAALLSERLASGCEAVDARDEIAERWSIWRAEKARRETEEAGRGVGSAAVFAAASISSSSDETKTVLAE